MTHLMVVATVPPLVPALTLQMMSRLSAASSVPRSVMVSWSASFLTSQTGPLYGSPCTRPKNRKSIDPTKLPPPVVARPMPLPLPRRAGLPFGRREEPGGRELLGGLTEEDRPLPGLVS